MLERDLKTAGTPNENLLKAAPGNPQNHTAQNMHITTFLCPSDTDRLASTAGHNNYVGNNGSGTATNGTSPSGVIKRAL